MMLSKQLKIYSLISVPKQNQKQPKTNRKAIWCEHGIIWKIITVATEQESHTETVHILHKIRLECVHIFIYFST